MEETWQALNTSLAEHVALGERIRHTSAANLQKLANQRISRLWVELQRVIVGCAASGCDRSAVAGLSAADMCLPAEYRRTQQLAAAARARAEALLVPSCTKFPEGNLIIFPDRLQPGSFIRVEASVDPELYVDWSNL